jgi:hypothetical protein
MNPTNSPRWKALLAAFLPLCPLHVALAKPEAIEISKNTTALLPGGKEADAIIGDILLRNDRIETVISGNLPMRRANMSTFYGADGITPGCLYDLSLRGKNNDQITVFTPAFQQGPVSWVRPLPTDESEATIETFVSAASNGGISRRHLYTLRDGWQGVLITTTLKNESNAPLKTAFQDRWTNFLKTGFAPGGIRWADAVDPADRSGYAVGPLSDPSNALKRAPGELKPGETLTYSRFLAVANSPAEAVGIVAQQQGPVATLEGSLLDSDGHPVPASSVAIRPQFPVVVPTQAAVKNASNNPDAQGRLSGIVYPENTGSFRLHVPPGKYRLTASAPGRPDLELPIECKVGETYPVRFVLAPAGLIAFEITDQSGVSIPCKAQFLALEGTEPVNLGPDQRAHGCRDQFHHESGRFEVPIPPGRYRVVVTRGIEYSHLDQTVQVEAGKTIRIQGKLKRLVDSTGWVSADYHNHSTPSGDNVCGTADRLINLAAEHIEFAPTTEHNRLYDWRPEIERLGLTPFLQTVPGVENTGSKAHFNAFPFQPSPFSQDNGAPVWNADPRLTALQLREWQTAEPDRWVQINHPDLFENFFVDRGTGETGGGFAGLIHMIDGFETQNGASANLLAGVPFSIGRNAAGVESVNWKREFLWLQMLNQGRRAAAMAVCDAHAVFGNGVGLWRMYLPSASDDPAKIDWRENSRAAKAGVSYLTSGPFLQVTTNDGARPGSTVRPKNGTVQLHVKVQCTDWIDIDRVQILVNGRMPKALNFTRSSHPSFFQNGVVKFDQTLSVPLEKDAHLIVVAAGENSTLQTGYGSSPYAAMKPFAYHNPIFVDVDGNGFQPNGDLLGFPYSGKPVSVAEAKAMLEAHKAAAAPKE